MLVERGLDTDAQTFLDDVGAILCDPRGWTAGRAVRFTYDADARLLVSLRTPASTEKRCLELINLSVGHRYSCGHPRESVINAARWFGNAEPWLEANEPLSKYREMLINHEMGHSMGLHHQQCRREGAKAPVMMQQSKGNNLNGKTCRYNPWPLPDELARLTRIS